MHSSPSATLDLALSEWSKDMLLQRPYTVGASVVQAQLVPVFQTLETHPRRFGMALS